MHELYQDIDQIYQHSASINIFILNVNMTSQDIILNKEWRQLLFIFRLAEVRSGHRHFPRNGIQNGMMCTTLQNVGPQCTLEKPFAMELKLTRL